MTDARITPRDMLLDAALDLAAEDGWSAVTIAAAAKRAGLEPAQARRIARGRAELLVRLGERVDAAMLEALDEDAHDSDISVRDRLFDVLMMMCISKLKKNFSFFAKKKLFLFRLEQRARHRRLFGKNVAYAHTPYGHARQPHPRQFPVLVHAGG